MAAPCVPSCSTDARAASAVLPGLLLGLAVAGCAGPSARQATADTLAAEGGLAAERIAAGPFDLAAWRRPAEASAITIYIEGDGHAWTERSRPSPDPTPREPLALRLAALDPAPAVAALARPCQYRIAAVRPQPLCDDPAWWTGARFAPPAIDAMDRAVDLLKRSARAKAVHLVGFSGGGAVAVLLAARRPDVASLRTVAGNLDPALVNRLHGVEPLAGSLSPRDVADRVAAIPQIHFTGARDRVVPAEVARSFLQAMFQAMSGARCAQTVEVDADHHSGWPERWPALLQLRPPCPRPACRPVTARSAPASRWRGWSGRHRPAGRASPRAGPRRSRRCRRRRGWGNGRRGRR